MSINNLQKYSIKTFAKPIPIYCVGDSHSIVYDNIYFTEESQLGHSFHCKSFYQPGFSSVSWLDDQGNLSKNIITVLKKLHQQIKYRMLFNLIFFTINKLQINSIQLQIFHRSRHVFISLICLFKLFIIQFIFIFEHIIHIIIIINKQLVCGKIYHQ